MYVPLFDERAVLTHYPRLKDVIIKAENYTTKVDQEEIWVVDEERTLDIGMKLKLEVVGYNDMTNVYLIPSSGVINIKYIREVTVKGKTLRSVREEIEKRLKEYLLEPQVVLSVMGYARKESGGGGVVTIAGSVAKSGQFELSLSNPYLKSSTPQTLFMLVVKAGRRSDSALTQVMVIRKDRNSHRVIVCDLVKFNIMSDISQNIVLRDGDIVVVPALYSEKEQIPKELEYIDAYISGRIDVAGLMQKLGNR